MKQFELRHYILNELNSHIFTNPLDLDSIEINHLFRKYSAKGEESNYIEVEIVDQFQKQTIGGDKQTQQVYFDCYSTNEIMADRIRWKLKERLNEFADNEFTLQNVRLDQGIARLDNNRYVGRVTATLYIIECCR